MFVSISVLITALRQAILQRQKDVSTAKWALEHDAQRQSSALGRSHVQDPGKPNHCSSGLKGLIQTLEPAILRSVSQDENDHHGPSSVKPQKCP